MVLQGRLCGRVGRRRVFSLEWPLAIASGHSSFRALISCGGGSLSSYQRSASPVEVPVCWCGSLTTRMPVGAAASTPPSAVGLQFASGGGDEADGGVRTRPAGRCAASNAASSSASSVRTLGGRRRRASWCPTRPRWPLSRTAAAMDEIRGFPTQARTSEARATTLRGGPSMARCRRPGRRDGAHRGRGRRMAPVAIWRTGAFFALEPTSLLRTVGKRTKAISGCLRLSAVLAARIDMCAAAPTGRSCPGAWLPSPLVFAVSAGHRRGHRLGRNRMRRRRSRARERSCAPGRTSRR
jgi:hypothetical protein